MIVWIGLFFFFGKIDVDFIMESEENVQIKARGWSGIPVFCQFQSSTNGKTRTANYVQSQMFNFPES